MMRKTLTATLLAAIIFAPVAADAGKKICSEFVKAGNQRPAVFNGKKAPRIMKKKPSLEDAFCDAYYQLPNIDQFVNKRLGRGQRIIEISSFMKGSHGGEDLFVWDVPEGRFMYWSDDDEAIVLYRRRQLIFTRNGNPLRARRFDGRDFALGYLNSAKIQKAYVRAKREEKRIDDPFPYKAIRWLYEPEKKYVPEQYHMPPLEIPELNAMSAENSHPQSLGGEEGKHPFDDDSPMSKIEEEFRKRIKN